MTPDPVAPILEKDYLVLRDRAISRYRAGENYVGTFMNHMHELMQQMPPLDRKEVIGWVFRQEDAELLAEAIERGDISKPVPAMLIVDTIRWLIENTPADAVGHFLCHQVLSTYKWDQ